MVRRFDGYRGRRDYGRGRGGFDSFGGPFIGGLAGGLLGSVLFPGYGYGYPRYNYPYYPYVYPPYGYPPYGFPPYGYYRRF